MNKLLRIVINGILVILVLVPLGLLGTCSVVGGFNGLLSFNIGGFIWGIFLIGLGLGAWWLVNRIQKKMKGQQ